MGDNTPPADHRPALRFEPPADWQPSRRLTSALAALLLGIAERRVATSTAAPTATGKRDSQ